MKKIMFIGDKLNRYLTLIHGVKKIIRRWLTDFERKKVNEKRCQAIC